MLRTIKKLQVQYLQAKTYHDVIKTVQSFEKLTTAEKALIDFGISIIPDCPARISKEVHQKILELVSSF